MEAETASRYRSRILREMNANRNNPFNSPPSSTGSHGTVSPTLSSVFSDPDGESTRRLNEDIARVTAQNKLPINFEAAHRKWPEFYSMPKSRSAPIFEDHTDTRPLSAESKENKSPRATKKHVEDNDTRGTWEGSIRTREQMQPRVDNESDLSSILSKTPARGTTAKSHLKGTYNPSPLAKAHPRSPPTYESHHQKPHPQTDVRDFSPHMSSAKSSLTAVAQSPGSIMGRSPVNHDASHVRSFFMPDVSHLGDFVTGTLRFNGAMKNGVPVLVKNGKVYDQGEKRSQATHAEVGGLEVPEDEEKIFVSMDMIRKEIISLQEHYDKVQEYAASLEQQVEILESEKHLTPSPDIVGRERLDRKLQEACENINKLTRRLSAKEKELDDTNMRLESTEQIRHDNGLLQREIVTLKHRRDALELEYEVSQKQTKSLEEEIRGLKQHNEAVLAENTALRASNYELMNGNNEMVAESEHNKDLIKTKKLLEQANSGLVNENEDLREKIQVHIAENRTLRSTNRDLMNDNEELRHKVESHDEEKHNLREDNESLVRHNEKYFNDNKILRRENSAFERSIQELHDENLKLKEDVDFLKQQMDNCRQIPKEDFSARLDEEIEENMTSGFFMQDITIKTNDLAVDGQTEARDEPTLPELTAHSNRLSTIQDVTEEPTQESIMQNASSQNKKLPTRQRSMSNSRLASKGSSNANAKVAFSVPEDSISMSKSASNLANKGSKRRSTSQSRRNSTAKKATQSDVERFTDNDDTTGLLSVDNVTDEHAIPIKQPMKSKKEPKTEEQHRRSRPRDVTNQSQKSQPARSHSRSSMKRVATVDVTTGSHQTDTCPALSADARRILDVLCAHNCSNCMVCTRIASHRGTMSSAELAVGKKRVTVSRPVPVTDRDLTAEDPTMRPSQSPGQALALVIKGLEDEAQHLQLELTHLQSEYSARDNALGRSQRRSLVESISALMKKLEAKKDQIYNLYDVLEGQKAAGQEMTEEEIEMTVFNITGMTVRDVTTGSEQLTWEGLPDL